MGSFIIAFVLVGHLATCSIGYFVFALIMTLWYDVTHFQDQIDAAADKEEEKELRELERIRRKAKAGAILSRKEKRLAFKHKQHQEENREILAWLKD